MMIEEDCLASENIKFDLVFQREEAESYYEQITGQNEDVKVVCELL
jgi:hypothetical protein